MVRPKKKETKASKKKKSDKVTQLRPRGRPRKEKPAAARAAGLGHNTGKVNPQLQKIYEEYHELDENAKAISRGKRDLRARAKEEFGVMTAVFNHEFKLQKLDQQARVEFETGALHLKDALGIQLALPLAQPDEDEEEGDDDTDRRPDRAAEDDDDDDSDPEAAAARAAGEA